MAVAVAFGAGCGNASGQKVVVDATPAAMRKSAEATLDKGTERIDMTIGMSMLGQDVSMTGTGVMDPPHKRFQLDLDVKDLFTKLLQGKNVPPEVASTFDQPMTEIMDGTVIYMHFPLLAKVGGSGKEWMKVDLAAANSSIGNLLGGSGSGAFGSDPTAFLQFLEGTGNVSKVGTEEVRGVTTTHFSGSYTLNDALTSLPADRRQKVEDAYSGLGLPDSARNADIPFDAWVDADGLVRKIEMTIDAATFAPSGKTPLGKMSISMELYDFGTTVNITTPSEDEVVDMSSLAASGASRFSNAASSTGG
jgi:hypothetical protein